MENLWKNLNELGILSGEFKGFGRMYSGGGVPVSVDSLYMLGLSCVPVEPMKVDKRAGRYVLIYGSEAFARWPRSDAFFSWPFFPLMADEGGSVGLVPDSEKRGLSVAWVADQCLYDDEMPNDDDLIFISKRPIWELPDIARILMSQDDEMDFLDRLYDSEVRLDSP